VELEVQAPSGDAPRGHGELVLLADDRPQFRASARRVLESLGYRVLEAQDGAEAVDVFFHHQQEVRLLMLDAMMPKLSGVEAAQRIRQLAPAVPVLLATGFDAAEAEQKKLTPPMEVIAKPFRAEELARTLRALLDGEAP
jgi:CheY-like chemotaxis protein